MPLRIEIEPMDTLFFRDNRPFDAGVDTGAESIFPSPLTLFGIIGSYYLQCNNKTLADINGSNTKLGAYDESLKGTNLKIKGPFIAYDNKVYLPCPANLWASKSSLLKPFEPKSSDVITDIGRNCFKIMGMDLGGYIDPKPLVSHITLEAMQKYLSMSLKSLVMDKKDNEELFANEFRFGHAINSQSNTVEEGMLYFTTHLRSRETLKYVSVAKPTFLVEASGLDASDFSNGSARIGGEGRIAQLKINNADVDLVPKDQRVIDLIRQRKRFLLCLATPAIFKDGWFGDWQRLFEKAIMSGACINKPIYISGWMRNPTGAGGVPRPLYKAVPAGSVYFFEAPDWNDDYFGQMYYRYHFNCSVSDIYPSAGLGTVLVGAW